MTKRAHPYIDCWWPPGHSIGWEHTVIHPISHLLMGVARGEQTLPPFYDGLRCQQALDAVVASARRGRWESIPNT